MQAAEAQGCSSSGRPAGVRVGQPHKARRSSDCPDIYQPHKRIDRARVTIGMTIKRWRSVKQACGLRTDEDVAKYLLDVMKNNSTASESSGSSDAKIRISQSAVKALIEQEVRIVQAKNDRKMHGLIEAVQQANNSTNFEKFIKKIEAEVKLVSERAEVAIAYIKKTQNQGLSSSPVSKDMASEEDCDDDSTATLAQIDEKKMKCAIKSEKVTEMMKKTQSALNDVRANNEELIAAIEDLNSEEAPPILFPNGSWMETADERKHFHTDDNATMEDLDDRKPPPLLVPMDSKQTVHTRGIKRELEDYQYEENNVKVFEQPKLKKLKEERTSPVHSGNSADNKQEFLFYPALPTNPFPTVLNIEAASYSVPQKVELNLALIKNPTRLSVLWNVVEEDPTAPPMDSYIIFLTMEKAKGSGIFQRWYSYETLKATSLPMCALIKRYKPGHKVCAAVVGKDIFGRYGPYSKVVTATIPD